MTRTPAVRAPNNSSMTWKRCDSVMMPTSSPSRMTGRPLTLLSAMMRPACSTGASSSTVITSRVMTFSTVIFSSR